MASNNMEMLEMRQLRWEGLLVRQLIGLAVVVCLSTISSPAQTIESIVGDDGGHMLQPMPFRGWPPAIAHPVEKPSEWGSIDGPWMRERSADFLFSGIRMGYQNWDFELGRVFLENGTPAQFERREESKQSPF
jgi:hypothetical protein